MRFFVTGATGFIGWNLVRRLLKMGHYVHATISPNENTPPKGLQSCFSRDLRKISTKDLPQIDVVIHLSADNDTQSSDQAAIMEANLRAPADMFERFADKGCKQFIYASSAAVYGNSPLPFVEETTPLNPLTPYALSKQAFEQFADEYGKARNLNILGLRLSNVYGPGENHKESRSSTIRHLIARVTRGERPRMFWDGSQRRDWVYIQDVVDALVASISFDKGVEIINIGSGISTSFSDVLEIINKHIRNRNRIEWIPNPYPHTYQFNTECCIDKAKSLIGYSPNFDVYTGIADYIQKWQ